MTRSMTRMKCQAISIRTVFAVILALGLCQTSKAEPSPQAKPKIDAQADRLLKKMSDFLGSQKRFSFNAKHEIEVVTKAGQKLEFDANSLVSVERPNHLRSDRKGEIAQNLSFYYDGKTITLFGREQGYYASTPAPDTIDQAIDFAREKLDIEAPAADLLASNPYPVLMEDVVSGMYVGKTQIDGVPVFHLAFRGNETDWQIWIQEGDKPLPLKLLITSKKITRAPEFSVELKDWNLSPSFSANLFAFSPPPDATRIQFSGISDSKPDTHKGKG